MQLDKVRRLAADVLKTGENRIWMDPAENEKISEVITKEDVRVLITEGFIKKKSARGQSTGRSKALRIQKKKGRRRGMGKRKGTLQSRTPKKKSWMKNVRAQRKKLRELRENNPKDVEKVGYSDVYRKIKGNYFRGKKYVEAYVKGKGA